MRKGNAICDLLTPSSDANDASEVTSSGDLGVSDADGVYFELVRLLSADGSLYENAKVAGFIEKHATLRKDFGRLVKVLLKQGEAATCGKPGAEAEAKLVSALERAGWNHAARFFQRIHHVRYPKTYRLF